MKTGLRGAASLAAITALLITTNAWSQLPAEKLHPPEKLSAPDAHRAYVLNLSYNNFMLGKIMVVDPEKKQFLGMITTGFLAPATLSNDRQTLYTADTFFSRGVMGKRTDVLTAWNTQTLDKRWEVEIPPKRSNTLTERYGLGISNDDRFAYVYNFTPAASVTVVDTRDHSVAGEIDISGCALNYPIGKRAFASICGDGSLQKVTIDDRGQEKSRSRTRFFDPNEVAMNERAVRNGDTYYFVTLDGEIQPIDVSQDTPKAGKRWSLFTDAQKKEGWGVGGWQLMAVSPALHRLYVLVHPDHSKRNWEDPSDTVWVYDLDSHEKIGELHGSSPMISLRATTDDKPLLLGGNMNGGLDVFDLKTSKHVGTMNELGELPALIFTH